VVDVNGERVALARKRRPNKVLFILGALGVIFLISLAGFLWFRPLKEYVNYVIYPPNYGGVVSVRPSNGGEVTPEMLTTAKRNFSRRLGITERRGMIISYKITEQPPNQLLVQMRFPPDRPGQDLLRPQSMSKQLTLNIVHNDSDKLVASTASVPDGFQVLSTAGNGNSQFVVSTKPLIEDAIEDAEPVVDTASSGSFAVNVQLTDEATRSLNNTLAKLGKFRLAVVLENKVITAPIFSTPLTKSTVLIAGHLNASQASDLAVLLRSGGVPWPIYLESGHFLK
jgi:hypothetical protein